MNAVPAAALFAVALVSARPLSQPLPDFTGTWTIDRERSESPQQTDTFTPTTYVITQTGAEVTIETRRGTARDTVTYPIGPPDARPAPPPAAAAPDAKRAARAYWSGRSLVTEGLRTIQGQTVSLRETRTLNPAGTEMTLQSLLVVQHGYTLKGAQNYGSATDIYRRVSPEPR